MKLINSQLNQKNINIATSALNIVTIYTLTNTIHIQKIAAPASYAFIHKTTQIIQNDDADKVSIAKS